MSVAVVVVCVLLLLSLGSVRCFLALEGDKGEVGRREENRGGLGQAEDAREGGREEVGMYGLGAATKITSE